MSDMAKAELARDAFLAVFGTMCIREILDANDYSNKREPMMAIGASVLAITFAFLCIVVARA